MHLDRVPAVAKYLSVVMLFSYLGRSAVWFFLPIYIENHIASVFIVGLITSIPPAVPVLLDIPVSNLVQRVGERAVILSGLVASIAPGAFYLVTAPAFLIMGKLSEGVAKTLIWNGGWSLSLKSSDDDVESETASIFLLGINLSVVIGPVFGGYVIATSGFDPLFYIWMATVGIGIMVFYRFIGAETEQSFGTALESLFHRSTYLEELRDYRHRFHDLRKPLALIFLYSILMSFNWLVIPLLLERTGAGFATMGLVFGIAGLPWLFQFGWAELADRYGRSRVIAGLSLAIIPVLVYLSTVESLIYTAALFIGAKVLLSGFSPAIHAIFDSRVDEKEEGEMMGLMEFTKHTGQVLGPVFAGAVSSVWSLNASFLGAGLVALTLLGVAAAEF